MHVSFKWQPVLGWWKHTAQLGEGEVGQRRFSGDVTSAGHSCLQDILSPGGLHMLPRCCSPSLERWIVLLNRIQTFGFLSEVSFLLIACLQCSACQYWASFWAGMGWCLFTSDCPCSMRYKQYAFSFVPQDVIAYVLNHQELSLT